MSLNLTLWRRIVPHVVSNLEGSLFRCSLGRRTLLTTCSFDLSKHSKENHNNINSHWSTNTSLSRRIGTSKVWSGEEGKDEVVADKKDDEGSQVGNDDQGNGDNTKEVAKGGAARGRPKNRGYLKDRTKFIPVEVSMRYIKSSAYKETYGDNLVWVLYRRNFKGQFAPKKTRRTCIRAGQLTTGHACPICRDEYLVLHPENVDLLKQFISPFNGEILHYTKTGLCQSQHEKLLVAVKQAKDIGVITFDVPFRKYDYSEYQKLYESYKSS